MKQNTIKVVTKDNYKQIVLQRMIIFSWVLLGICFLIKIFGGNFFQIVCNNDRFIALCDYVDNHWWLQYILGCISTLILQTLYLLAISKHLWFTRKREIIIVVVTMMIGVGLRLWSNIAGYVVDVYQYLLMPFLIKDDFHINVKIRRTILALALTIVFQLLSLLVKNIGIVVITDTNFLISIIWFIDVYIMVILYYLYSIKVEDNMGLFGGWLWGKSTKQLDRMRETRLAKIEKIKKEIAEIDAKRAKLIDANK